MFCNRTEEFLRTHNITFTDRDITQDARALADLEKLGLMTTPVTLVDGETVIGYDMTRLAALLGLPTGMITKVSIATVNVAAEGLHLTAMMSLLLCSS